MAHSIRKSRKQARRPPVQLQLRPRRQRTWGGAREGAGRKPSLPDLRDEFLSRQLQDCLRDGKQRQGFRLVHYCILTHHLHLIVEAVDASALTKGVRALSIRLARCINRFAGRSGRVFSDRYFAHTLRTPREVRNCISYVLLNCRRHARQHGRTLSSDWVDDCSSGRFFDGWRGSTRPPPADEPPTVAAAGTWLLSTGWRRWGLIRIDEIPGPRP